MRRFRSNLFSLSAHDGRIEVPHRKWYKAMRIISAAPPMLRQVGKCKNIQSTFSECRGEDENACRLRIGVAIRGVYNVLAWEVDHQSLLTICKLSHGPPRTNFFQSRKIIIAKEHCVIPNSLSPSTTCNIAHGHMLLLALSY